MRKILACVDLLDSTNAVVECARELAGPNGELFILHVAAPEPDFVGYAAGPASVRENVARDLRSEHQAVQQLADRARQPGLDVTPLTVQGVAVDRIVEHAERLGVHFVVVAASSHGALHDLVAGSVVRGLLRESKIPVVVVPAHGRTPRSGRASPGRQPR